MQELHAALLAAKAETSKPSIVSLRTIIGYPAPKKQNTGKIHGSALGSEEVAALKKVLGFDPEQSFEVDEDVLAHARAVVDRGAAARKEWQEAFEAWQSANPEARRPAGARRGPRSSRPNSTPPCRSSQPARTSPPAPPPARS